MEKEAEIFTEELMHPRISTILCTAFIVTVAAQKKNFAVTSLLDSEQFYFQMKHSRPSVTHAKDETFQYKVDICENIIKTPFFAILYHMGPVPPNDNAIHTNLKRNYPDIYKNFYETNNDSATDSDMRFTSNPYILRDVTTDQGLVQEYVCSCLAQNHRSGNIVEYFISPEYNVNDNPNQSAEIISGRFIFTRNDKNQLNVIALAEESAQKEPYNQASVENRYLNRSDEYKKEYSGNDTTICKLSTFQKVRLCSIILGAKEYQGKIMFLPEKKNIDPECERREVRFEYHIISSEETKHYDWMIGCKAFKVGSNEPVTYYVSKSVQANKFFVCKALKNAGAALDNISCKTSVVPPVTIPTGSHI